MTHYGYASQSADLHVVLWTEGSVDADYFVEFIINGEGGLPTWPIHAASDRAAAILSWTDPQGNPQEFTIATTAATPNAGGKNQTVTGEISVQAGSAVNLDCVCASGSYSVTLDTTP